MSVLFIEKDQTSDTNEEVQQGLKQNGYLVERKTTGDFIIDFIKTKKIEIILLDLSLSNLSGASIVSKIRAKGIQAPILILNSSPSVKR